MKEGMSSKKSDPVQKIQKENIGAGGREQEGTKERTWKSLENQNETIQGFSRKYIELTDKQIKTRQVYMVLGEQKDMVWYNVSNQVRILKVIYNNYSLPQERVRKVNASPMKA